MNHTTGLPAPRRGSVLIALVMFLPVLLAFTVATVDVGYLQSQKAHLQAVADVAVLSALGNVAWNGNDADSQQGDITARIAQVLQANGLTAGALGTPSFTVDDRGNVSRVALRTSVSAQTFFWGFLQPGMGSLKIQIETAADVTYASTWVPIHGNWGIYGRNRVYGAGTFSSGAYRRSEDLDTIAAINLGQNVVPASLSTDPAYPEEGIEVGSGGTIDLGGIQIVNGRVAANGDITLGNNVTVWSSDDNSGLELQFDPVPTPATNDNDTITVTLRGAARPLSSVLDASGSLNIGSADVVTLQPGRTYVFDEMIMNAQATLQVADWPAGTPDDLKTPTKIFVTGGDISINGNFFSNEQLEIRHVGNPAARAQVTCNGDAAMYMDLFAPDANVKLTGTGQMFGRVVGYEVWCNGSANFYYDKDLDALTGRMAQPVQVVVPAHLVQL